MLSVYAKFAFEILIVARFLWVSFQLDDICEAVSDAEIKQTIENLPNGIIETYERVLAKVQSASSHKIALVQKIFRWVSCARRPLQLAELKEAVAFEPLDECWTDEKIPTDPDGLRLIQSCRNLIVVDLDSTVRLAHHTVKQFLLSSVNDTFSDRFRFNLEETQADLGVLCITYLNFSDFEAQITVQPQQNQALMPALGYIGIVPSSYVIGIQGMVVDAWLSIRGVKLKRKPLSIDFAQLKRSRDPPPVSLQDKYRLLNYAIENWIYHCAELSDYFSPYPNIPPRSTRLYQILQSEDLNHLIWSSFNKLVFQQVRTFDFRPWNETKGPDGLPHLCLFLWAIGAGIPSLLVLIEETCSLSRYYRFAEEHNLNPMGKACGTGNVKVVRMLLDAEPSAFRSNGALLEAISHGHAQILKLLIQKGVTREMYMEVEKKSGKKLLPEAVILGSEDIVRELLRFGKDNPCFSERDVNVAFRESAARGHSGIMKLLLDFPKHHWYKDAAPALEGVGVGTLHTYWNSTTILKDLVLVATKEGHDDILLLLFKAAWTEFRSPPQATLPLEQALILGAKLGHKGVVRVCLDNGINFSSKANVGSEALHKAIGEGHEHVVRLLLEEGASLKGNGEPEYQGWSNRYYSSNVDHDEYRLYDTIQRAWDSGKHDIVRLLLEVESTIARYGINKLLLTALAFAHTDLAKCLLDHGAKVDAVETQGHQPLHLAAVNGNTPLVETLLDKGASVNGRMVTGQFAFQQPLHLAIESGFLDTAKILIERGADVNGGLDRAPLWSAVSRNDLEAAMLLLKNGAGTNIVDAEESLLHVAAKSGNGDMIKLLIDHGIDTETVHSSRRPALHIAIQCLHMSAAEALLEGGADPNTRNSDGENAVHLACSRNNGELAVMLLERGADKLAVTSEGLSALDLAAFFRHAKLVPQLVDRGLEFNPFGLYYHITRLAPPIKHIPEGIMHILRSECAKTFKRSGAWGGLFHLLALRPFEFQGDDGACGLDWQIVRADDLNTVDRYGWTALDVASIIDCYMPQSGFDKSMAHLEAMGGKRSGLSAADLGKRQDWLGSKARQMLTP
jgi:ankyrin repeat protein